jgi:hypothetical protein
MKLKDVTIGMRVQTSFGPGTVTAVTAAKYVDLQLDNRVPGRPDMNDRSWQTIPRNIRPLEGQ